MTQETTSTTTANVRPGSASKKAGKIKTNVVTQEKNSAKVIKIIKQRKFFIVLM